MNKDDIVSNPKVFISYSWTCQKRVIELAERLVDNGIDVIIDIWDLEPGQDINHFIEQCVVDPTINKVLMICDKTYAEKADGREGGVGKETRVISPKIYEKATENKYIPIIFEYDEQGKAYTPAYLKSSFYIDLSSDDEKYETEYERLIRHILNKPEFKKPPLGKIPEWLDDDVVSLRKLRTAIKTIKSLGEKNHNKLYIIIQDFKFDFSKTLQEYKPTINENYNKNIIQQFDATKPLRDLYIEYIESLLGFEIDIGDILGDFIETVYNETYNAGERNSYVKSDNEFEIYLVFIWEIFICTTATLFHFDRYAEIFSLLNRTYYLNRSPVVKDKKECAFTTFRHYPKIFDRVIKQLDPECRAYTPTGDLIIKREKKPIITKQSLANTDIILYQLSTIYVTIKELGSYDLYWFPDLYIYSECLDKSLEIWRKMKSQKQCKKLFPLFGVTNISELIDQIQKNKENNSMRHDCCHYRTPHILTDIDINDIGKLP